MKKFKAIVITTIFAAAASLSYAYPVSDVIGACERAYSNGSQIQACIANVCDTYGCTYSE